MIKHNILFNTLNTFCHHIPIHKGKIKSNVLTIQDRIQGLFELLRDLQLSL